MKEQIQLGDKVKCIYTGFTGIAVSRIEFINGCVQYEIAPRVGKENKMPEGVYVDEQSLEVVRIRKKKRVKKETGGPNRPSVKMRGY